MKQIAEALQYAHDEKLVHRDIKPENMLVGRHNEILLSDFGIALIAQSSRYQSTQDVIGTVAYMSPEQIQGKPRKESDQYSLGIVVYEWLSGDRPFHGSFAELCTQHMFASPLSLHEKVPTLLPDVEQVVTIALAKDPKQRFGSVQAFATALEQANASQQPAFVAPSKPAPLPSHSRPLPTPPVLPPTQTPATPQSFPSNQTAMPLQQTSLSTSTNSPTNVQPVVKTSNEEINIWKMGNREVVAAFIGIVLCAGLSYLATLFAPSFVPALWGSLTLLISALLGMRFGPWAGLIAGGIGVFIGLLVANSYLGPTVVAWLAWALPLGNALAGFVAGLTILITKRRYNIRNIVLADTIIAISVFLSFGIPSEIAFYQMGSVWDSIGFLALPSSIFVLILLPILLIIYNAIINRRRRA